MKIQESAKTKIRWSGHLIAVLALFIAIGLLQVHQYVSCDASGKIGSVGMISALVAGFSETCVAQYQRLNLVIIGAGGWAIFLLTPVYIH